jgi:branched-chain amino acid transport system ATP-binding protein
MDEPAAGLSSSDAKNLGLWLRELTKKNIAILLIEHNMNLVMDISDHIVVLDHGELIAKGSPQEIRTNQKVIEAYLGQSR